MFDEPHFMQQLDALIDRIRRRHPSVAVRRIEFYPNMPGDDLIWYFTATDSPFEVQLDPGIDTLFLLSSDEHPEYVHAVDISQAAETMEGWLRLPAA